MIVADTISLRLKNILNVMFNGIILALLQAAMEHVERESILTGTAIALEQ